MHIVRIKQWLGRFPAIKRLIVRTLSRIPAMDLRLREAVHNAQNPRYEIQVDADHLPEDAAILFQRLRQRVAKGPRA